MAKEEVILSRLFNVLFRFGVEFLKFFPKTTLSDSDNCSIAYTIRFVKDFGRGVIYSKMA